MLVSLVIAARKAPQKPRKRTSPSQSLRCQRTPTPTKASSIKVQDSRPLSLRRSLLQKRLVDMHTTTTNANTSSFDCLQRRRVTLPRLRVTSSWPPFCVTATGMSGEDVQCLDFFFGAIFGERANVSFALELDWLLQSTRLE